jgi:membrane-bound ClpP family serine protease
MSQEKIAALSKLEQTIEHVARTRGRNTNEYDRAVREYQRMLARELEAMEALAGA